MTDHSAASPSSHSPRARRRLAERTGELAAIEPIPATAVDALGETLAVDGTVPAADPTAPSTQDTRASRRP